MRFSGAAINTTHFTAGHARRAGSAKAEAAAADREQLRAQFPDIAMLLYRRRADLIGDEVIERYVALQWLQWNGGALKLTVTGQNICDQHAAAPLASHGEIL